jgi:hypothetical protein
VSNTVSRGVQKYPILLQEGSRGVQYSLKRCPEVSNTVARGFSRCPIQSQEVSRSIQYCFSVVELQ